MGGGGRVEIQGRTKQPVEVVRPHPYHDSSTTNKAATVSGPQDSVFL